MLTRATIICFNSLIAGGVMNRGQDPLGLLGEKVDNYRLLRFIGSGNAGYVYEAESDGARCALKIYKDWLFETNAERQEARIRREVSLQHKVSHTSVCIILGHGGALVGSRNIRYLLMELLSGTPLSDVVADRGPLPVELARSIAVQLLSGLAALHSAGVVHRDVKPANVIIEGNESEDQFGRAVLTDFGVVGDLLEATQLTEGSEFLGTVRYSAPEWIFRSEDSTGREEAIDVYGAGAMLFEMLCGEPPFSHIGNRFELAVAVRTQLPKISRTGLPTSLITLVRQMMAKDPESRPTIDQCIAALDWEEPAVDQPTGDPITRLTEAAQSHALVLEHKRQIELGADQRRLHEVVGEALNEAWTVGKAYHPLMETGGFHALTGAWDDGVKVRLENYAELRRIYGRLVESALYHIHLQAYRGMIGGGVVYFLEGNSASAAIVRCVAVLTTLWSLQLDTVKDWAGSAEELAAFVRADQPEADRLLTLALAEANKSA